MNSLYLNYSTYQTPAFLLKQKFGTFVPNFLNNNISSQEQKKQTTLLNSEKCCLQITTDDFDIMEQMHSPPTKIFGFGLKRNTSNSSLDLLQIFTLS